MTTAYGIDFGTTNTRVAYFDGRTVRVVPFGTRNRGRTYHLPTAVAYQHGEAVEFGAEALAVSGDRGALYPEPLKWGLERDEPVECGGEPRDRVAVAADFLRNLRRLVAAECPDAPLDRAAVTIPVQYPPKARVRLGEAFREAGVEVSHFFYEPVAALYANLAAAPVSGVAAVFDWGGGSLDVATVGLADGVALTRHIDGWHRGGTHFDREVARHGLNAFLARHADHPVAGRLTPDRVLGVTAGRNLCLTAESLKPGLGRGEAATLTAINLLGAGNLVHPLSADLFHDLIRPDVTGGLARLDRALAVSGVTPRTLARLYLSGGTCHLPAVRRPLEAAYGDRLVSALRLPEGLVDPQARGGLDDIGNATAVGAALLAAVGAAPRFATHVGVRLAGGAGGGEQFLPVFRAGEPVPFDRPKEVKLFVADAADGVARLLVCDQDDPVGQPAGRLVRAMAVPIRPDDNWVVARFTVDRLLSLRVEAIGRKDFPVDKSSWKPAVDDWVPSLRLGFRLPQA